MVVGSVDSSPDSSGAVFEEGGDFSPLNLSEVVAAIDNLVQTLIVPLAVEGSGASPQGNAAWYPDIQPFNISTGVKLTPGYGEAYPVCSDVRFIVTCPDHPQHHAKPVFHRCHRPACPSCWKSWASRQTKSAAEAIEGYKEISGTRHNARHISIHPDPAQVPRFEDHTAALAWLYDQGREAAKYLGITAAITFPHPYRIRPDKKEEVEAAARAAGMKRYEWALSQPNWADLVYFSPHMHLIAYGHLQNSETFHNQTGWTYTNHDEKTKGRSGNALRETIYYLLTHTWVNGNSKVVRYLFGMSTHSMKRVDEGYTKMPVACPVCAAACVANPPDTERFDGTAQAIYQDLHNAPPAVRKVMYHHYEFRERKARQKPAIPLPAGVIA